MVDKTVKENKEKIGCEFCKKMDELTEDQVCEKIWACKIYARPGNEYKHFKPREV